jgi:hypothetical protein
MAQQVVDGLERRFWNGLAVRETSDHVPEDFTKRLRLSQGIFSVALPDLLDSFGLLISQETRLNEPGEQVLKRR